MKPRRSALQRVMTVAAVNVGLVALLMVPVELILGNWIRPFGLRDLRRFSIPSAVSYTFDPTLLYPADTHVATYTRNELGLRGATYSLPAIDVVTVGGSTTDQRYLDDAWTWQAVAERELANAGRPLRFTNAGVDGQSTVGHEFNFKNWFPLLDGLHPRIVLFYVGINDVLRVQDRDQYDRSVDVSTWRTKSALFQVFKALRGNLRARDAGVTHGRSLPGPEEFTDQGLLTDAERRELAAVVTGNFQMHLETLQKHVGAWSAVPIFVTQTAYGWNADRQPPRGRRAQIRIHGLTTNFADVAFIHQSLNRGLMEYCGAHGITCFDLAADVAFVSADYYDPLHNSLAGAEKIGRYLASRIATMDEALLRPPRQSGHEAQR